MPPPFFRCPIEGISPWLMPVPMDLNRLGKSYEK